MGEEMEDRARARALERRERARKSTPMHIICVLGINDKVLTPAQYQTFLRACAAIKMGNEWCEANVIHMRRRK